MLYYTILLYYTTNIFDIHLRVAVPRRAVGPGEELLQLREHAAAAERVRDAHHSEVLS